MHAPTDIAQKLNPIECGNVCVDNLGNISTNNGDSANSVGTFVDLSGELEEDLFARRPTALIAMLDDVIIIVTGRPLATKTVIRQQLIQSIIGFDLRNAATVLSIMSQKTSNVAVVT